MQIGTQEWNYKMADYLHSVALQVNSFHNNMVDKTNEYSLYLLNYSLTLGHSKVLLYV